MGRTGIFGGVWTTPFRVLGWEHQYRARCCPGGGENWGNFAQSAPKRCSSRLWGCQQGELLTLKPNDGFGGGKGKGKLSGNSSGLDQERFWLGILSPIVENQVGTGQSSQPPSGHLRQEFLDTPNSAFSSHAETFAGGTCTWGPLGEPPKHLHQGLYWGILVLDWVIWEVFSIFSEFIPCSVGATRPWKGGGSAGAHGEASPGCRAFCWPREGQFGFLFRGITQS